MSQTQGAWRNYIEGHKLSHLRHLLFSAVGYSFSTYYSLFYLFAALLLLFLVVSLVSHCSLLCYTVAIDVHSIEQVVDNNDV